jgi:hypothetical protein
MSTTGSSTFLRRVLLADAAISGVTGLALAAAAPALEGPLGAPAPFLRAAGLGLLPFAVFVGSLLGRPEPWRGGVWAVIALNVAWVVGSGVLLLNAGGVLTALGFAFGVGQAVAVAGLAELEYVGLRRAGLKAA